MKNSTIVARDEQLIGCKPEQILQSLPTRLHQTIEPYLGQIPTRTSIIYEKDHIVSYDDLNRNIDLLEQYFMDKGVRSGDRVVLINENCPELIICLLALSRLSATAVLINARLTHKECLLIINQADPRTVVYTSEVSSEAAKHAEQRSAEPFVIDGLSELHIEPIRDCDPDTVLNNGHDIAAMIFTTGTTGNPKGVMLSHYNLLFVAFVASKLRGMTPEDRVYAVLPIAHVYGLASMLMGTLFNGATLCLYTKFSPSNCLEALIEQQCTTMFGVPAMYAKLLEHIAVNKLTLPKLSLRFAYAGGSPIDTTAKKEAEDLLAVPLHNGYGLTESSPSITQTRSYSPVDDTSVGFVIPGVDVEVRNPHNDQEILPVGEIGELWVKGPNVMRGYFREPEKTADVLKNKWLNTGDLAYINDAAKIYIVGRTKELIIRSGFNVFPPEVEAVINAFSGITMSAVVGVLQNDGNEEIVAFIEPMPGTKISKELLNKHIKDHLAPYKRPAKIEVLERLPASATGKPLKAQLKQQAQQLFQD